MNKDSTYILPSFAGSSDCNIDSTSYICEVKGQATIQEGKEHNFFGTDLFANLVSAGALLITLIIFIYQTTQARKEQRRTIKENWYLKFILQPNLEELKNFYKNEALQLENQISILKGTNGKEVTKKAQSIKLLRDLKNDFFNHFILMLQGYDIYIAQDAENILNELADFNAECIDNYKSDDITDIKRKVFENKAKLINALYKGISKDSGKQKALR